MRAITVQKKLIGIVTSVVMLILVVLSFSGVADTVGQEYTETGFKRALITFASARAINGLISVAQGTQLAVQPAGVGAVFTPGEILDPVNDLVEQFSQVMLYSAAVLGTQRLLIEMSGWFWFSVLLASVVLFALATFWLPHFFRQRTRQMAFALAGLLLLFRFFVPVAAIANETVFDLFLASEYSQSYRQLEGTNGKLGSEDKRLGPPDDRAESEKLFSEKVREYYESIKEKTDVAAKIEALKAAANETITDIINLIIVFLVQTLLLPLLFIWFGYSAAKALVRYALQTSRQ